ncbi:hypothetical protein HPGCJGGD_3996 [Methylobacterium haplocladii]|nr:hypothetical protein HPGCJGGD_3996 [Methylobacterium haplocladii]
MASLSFDGIAAAMRCVGTALPVTTGALAADATTMR